jgi:uncharacterized LabA/DUF88 family protein
MSRVAVFVDAGYLFAQGSLALTGATQHRSYVKIDVPHAIAELTTHAGLKCPGGRLLRIYWYDASPPARTSEVHRALASTDYVKLRLGTLNSAGQQKGVDSLIVTDMIELARNRAITDAVLLSGDEDVRIGVQLSQAFGVAVHLLGIHPARGSQSALLRQEADTVSEWGKGNVGRFMTVTSSSAGPELEPGGGAPPTEGLPLTQDPRLQSVVEQMVGALDENERHRLVNLWAEGDKMVPVEIDRPMMAQSGDAIGRFLSKAELQRVRNYFKFKVTESIQSPT